MPAATLEKATHQLTRRSNERLVLRTDLRAGTPQPGRRRPCHRADADDRLRRRGGSHRRGPGPGDGRGPSTGGKAPILLEVPADARHLVGVDVDRDRLSGVIVNLRGEVRGRGLSGPGRPRWPEALRDLGLARLGPHARGRASHWPASASARPGSSTPPRASCAGRWAWTGVTCRSVPRLTELTGLPVVVVNDSQAAAMGEWAFGRHDASSAMIVVKVGEGIGAGVVIGGRLYPGDDSGAGEIGHTRVGDGDAACRCGGRAAWRRWPACEPCSSARGRWPRTTRSRCSPAVPSRAASCWPPSAPATRWRAGSCSRRRGRWAACWGP